MIDTIRQPLRRALVLGHARAVTTRGQLREVLASRLDYRDEQGDVAPRTVAIAVMAGIALTVGAIIKAKLEAKANALDLGE